MINVKPNWLIHVLDEACKGLIPIESLSPNRYELCDNSNFTFRKLLNLLLYVYKGYEDIISQYEINLISVAGFYEEYAQTIEFSVLHDLKFEVTLHSREIYVDGVKIIKKFWISQFKCIKKDGTIHKELTGKYPIEENIFNPFALTKINI